MADEAESVDMDNKVIKATSALSAGWVAYWLAVFNTQFYWVCGAPETENAWVLFIMDLFRFVLSLGLFFYPLAQKQLSELPHFEKISWAFGVLACALCFTYLWVAEGSLNDDCLQFQDAEVDWKNHVLDKLGISENDYLNYEIQHMPLLYHAENWCEARIEALTGKRGHSLQHCLRYSTGKFNLMADSALYIDLAFDILRAFCTAYIILQQRQGKDKDFKAKSGATKVDFPVESDKDRSLWRRRSTSNSYQPLRRSSRIHF